ncbi:hypothetical protein J6590_097768 [Homalodisca vitripennis]|nr:hypothetical protein J6590_097768 [Homalodisca vitripennis]
MCVLYSVCVCGLLAAETIDHLKAFGLSGRVVKRLRAVVYKVQEMSCFSPVISPSCVVAENLLFCALLKDGHHDGHYC